MERIHDEVFCLFSGGNMAEVLVWWRGCKRGFPQLWLRKVVFIMRMQGLLYFILCCVYDRVGTILPSELLDLFLAWLDYPIEISVQLDNVFCMHDCLDWYSFCLRPAFE